VKAGVMPSPTSEWIEEFQKQYLHIVLIDEQPGDVVSYIPEKEAWKKVSHFGFSKRALRKHCGEKGKCERTGRTKWQYDEQYILQLSQEWVNTFKVRDKMQHNSPRCRVYRDIKRKKWTTMKIGRIFLIKKTDLF
jgi:hypothetical protein